MNLLPGNRTTLLLTPGWQLTVTPGGTARVYPTVAGTPISDVTSATTFGPHAAAINYTIESLVGETTWSDAPVDFPTAGEAAAAAAAWIVAPGDLVEIVGEGAPVDYTDGDPVATGEGVAGIGSRYTDISAGTLYLNTGTKAEPIWTQLAPVA